MKWNDKRQNWKISAMCPSLSLNAYNLITKIKTTVSRN